MIEDNLLMKNVRSQYNVKNSLFIVDYSLSLAISPKYWQNLGLK